jgi:hypothetical protein
MQKGKENDAADLANKLAEKRVRLQFKESEKLSNEKPFPYVKINFHSFL